VSEEENSIFCVFEDNKNFKEYYDLSKDPEQLKNLAMLLTDDEKKFYISRIKELKECKGFGCSLKGTKKSLLKRLKHGLPIKTLHRGTMQIKKSI